MESVGVSQDDSSFFLLEVGALDTVLLFRLGGSGFRLYYRWLPESMYTHD